MLVSSEDLQTNVDLVKKIKDLEIEVGLIKKNISGLFRESEREFQFIKHVSKAVEKEFSGARDMTKEIDQHLQKTEEYKIILKTAQESITELKNESEIDFNKQREDIQKIIDHANRASMAGSFKSRKDEITRLIESYDIITYLSLISISLILGYLFITSVDNKNFSFIQFFFKISDHFTFIMVSLVD